MADVIIVTPQPMDNPLCQASTGALRRPLFSTCRLPNVPTSLQRLSRLLSL